MTKPNFEDVKKYVFGRLETELADNLYYHGIHHTRNDVLPSAERLAKLEGISTDDILLLLTGALYHDIGFIEKYNENEPIAVRIASETLPNFGYSRSQIKVIGRIIMATQLPQSPKTILEKIMCDADLDNLGREDFFILSMNLRRERAAYGIEQSIRAWYESSLKFLENHSYFTNAAKSLRQEVKEKNIREIKELLVKF